METHGTISSILKQKSHDLWSIASDAMVFEAIQLMADKNVGALLVVSEGRLVGVISERDYTRKVALKGKSSKQTAVREIISGQVIQVQPENTVEDCMRLMTEHRIRHLPVVERGEICGIVSIGDLVKHRMERIEAEAEAMRAYIQSA